MDFVKILGGLALGATGAALFDALRSSKTLLGNKMGQGVITGGFGGGPAGGGGGGPGLVVGPPSGGGGGGGFGPGVIDMMPPEGGQGEVGPIVSVTPEIVGPGLPGGSFFGVSSSPWFWPLNVNWLYPRPPMDMVCVKAETEDEEEILVCEQSYEVFPARRSYPVAYAWGPPAGWL
jgi:hypothetical protein